MHSQIFRFRAGLLAITVGAALLFSLEGRATETYIGTGKPTRCGSGSDKSDFGLKIVIASQSPLVGFVADDDGRYEYFEKGRVTRSGRFRAVTDHGTVFTGHVSRSGVLRGNWRGDGCRGRIILRR